VVFMPCGYGLRAAVEEARRTLLTGLTRWP
jgi:hypothetical protein